MARGKPPRQKERPLADFAIGGVNHRSIKSIKLMKLGLDPKCEVLDLGGKHHTVVGGAEGELGSVVCERGGDKSRRGLVCERSTCTAWCRKTQTWRSVLWMEGLTVPTVLRTN